MRLSETTKLQEGQNIASQLKKRPSFLVKITWKYVIARITNKNIFFIIAKRSSFSMLIWRREQIIVTTLRTLKMSLKESPSFRSYVHSIFLLLLSFTFLWTPLEEAEIPSQILGDIPRFFIIKLSLVKVSENRRKRLVEKQSWILGHHIVRYVCQYRVCYVYLSSVSFNSCNY